MTVFQEQKKAEDQGAWFKYQGSHYDKDKKEFVFDDPAPDAAEFCVRQVTSFFVERLKARKKERQFVLNPQSGKMEMVSFYPDPTPEEAQTETDDVIDYSITGIKNAKWADGRLIESTRENKLKLMKDEQFDRFVGHCFKTLSDNESKEAEVKEKN